MFENVSFNSKNRVLFAEYVRKAKPALKKIGVVVERISAKCNDELFVKFDSEESFKDMLKRCGETKRWMSRTGMFFTMEDFVTMYNDILKIPANIAVVAKIKELTASMQELDARGAESWDIKHEARKWLGETATVTFANGTSITMNTGDIDIDVKEMESIAKLYLDTIGGVKNTRAYNDMIKEYMKLEKESKKLMK